MLKLIQTVESWIPAINLGLQWLQNEQKKEYADKEYTYPRPLSADYK
jgi:hypothetical protein